jgi:hypothetical protein
MRVHFETDGGFAYIPGLQDEPMFIDTDDLRLEDANELEGLIEAAHFFDLPAVSLPPRGAADYLEYTISVTTPGRTHTVRVPDPIRDPHVQALVNYLRKKAQEKRAEG